VQGRLHNDFKCSPATTRRRGNLAVKVIRKGATEALGDVERSVMWEVHVLQKLNHDHIVRVMDVIEVVDATYIIMQRVDGPELTEFIESHPQRRLPPECACLFFGHMLSGLRHAHKHGFLHCDIKPDNVRLSKACDHAVLTDWGFSRRAGERCDGYFCGTPAYASPEQLTGYSPDSVSGQRKLRPATDAWSLGVTLFEMVTGSLPFCGDDYETLVRKVLSTKYRVPDYVPSPIAALIEGMLVICPLDRLDVEEIIASAHFKSTGVAVPNDKETHTVGLDGDFVCGSCEAGDTTDTGCDRADAMLRRVGLSAQSCKRMLWALVYGTLCFSAIWSHLQSSGVEEQHFQVHDTVVP